MKKITLSDIAQQLNVSVVTVSKALSGKEGVSHETRQRILKTANQLGYSTKTHENQNRFIGVLVSERYMRINKSFYWDVYQHIVQHLTSVNSVALLEIITKESEAGVHLPSILQNQQLDGLVVLGSFPKAYIDQLVVTTNPLVFLDFYDSRHDVDAIISDNFVSAQKLTNYLIQSGHKQIGFVGNIHALGNILDRYMGFNKTMTENNLEVNDKWILNDRDTDDRLYTDFSLPATLPTAFICDCDETAYHLMATLKKANISVPADISVVSFDNYIYATLTDPHLTTIEVNIERMAKETISLLQQKLEDPNYRTGIKVVPGTLIIRDSVRRLS